MRAVLITLPDFEANLEANCIPGNIYEMTLKDYDENEITRFP